MIRVCIVGAQGRMGSETVLAVGGAGDMTVSLAVDRIGQVTSLPDPLDGCDVMVEFTHAESATAHAVIAARSGVSPIIGASGLTSSQQAQVAEACKVGGVGGVLVPNFAIGAVLMMKFAEEAARWLPNAEVIEMHHDKKTDAPSGTGIRTAELISAARQSFRNVDPTTSVKYDGSRGALVVDVNIHSVRLPGLVAHQAVMFGGEGEVLTIRHDSMNRLSFMEGVKLAIRRVRELEGFVVGLDKLMD